MSRNLKRLCCLLPVLMTAGTLLAQSVPTNPLPVESDLEFLRLLVMLVVGLVCLVAVGIGIALGVALLVLAGVLVSGGVVTSSVIVGLVTGRVSAGWRTFLILSFVIVLTVCGAAAGWGFEKLSHTPLSISGSVILGGMMGAIAGLIAATGFDWMLRLTARRASVLLEQPWAARLRGRLLPQPFHLKHQPTTMP